MDVEEKRLRTAESVRDVVLCLGVSVAVGPQARRLKE